MERFASVPEQLEAKRLLDGCADDGPAHAYLLHGPPGVGKRTAALAFAAALLGDDARASRLARIPTSTSSSRSGSSIRIDDVRALRHDLHMRPFEARSPRLPRPRRRADERGRCRRAAQGPRGAAAVRGDRARRERARPAAADHPLALPARPLPEALGARGAGVDHGAGAGAERGRDPRALARVAGGTARSRAPPARLGRGRPARGAHRGRTRPPTSTPSSSPARPPRRCSRSPTQHGQEAKEREQAALEGVDLPAREADQRVRRAQRGAERDELLAGLEALEAWYRDLVVVAAGAESAAVNADRLDDLREDAARDLGDGPLHAAEAVRETWRALEEFNLNAPLALEALFVRLQRELRGVHAWS